MGAPLISLSGAYAATVPPSEFTCGSPPLLGPCNQTAHFSDINQVGSPLSGPATNCPAWATTDFITIVGSGNGVEHSIVNTAGDGWFTLTFTGIVTLTAYPPRSVNNTDPNNPIIIGPPDSEVLPYTGRLTQWFGGNFNKYNRVFSLTIHFMGTAADSSTFQVSVVQHFGTTAVPLAPPHTFELGRC
ncbi:MAG: hypothetical protein NVS3B21_23100 [Acidimicrobiales bacterium]